MKLCWKAAGLTLGLFWGLTLFVSTLLAVYTGYLHDFVSLMVGVYPWYQVTLPGAFIGLGEAFLDGFVGGSLLILLYNFICSHCCGCCCKENCKKKK